LLVLFYSGGVALNISSGVWLGFFSQIAKVHWRKFCDEWDLLVWQNKNIECGAFFRGKAVLGTHLIVLQQAGIRDKQEFVTSNFSRGMFFVSKQKFRKVFFSKNPRKLKKIPSKRMFWTGYTPRNKSLYYFKNFLNFAFILGKKYWKFSP